MRVNHSLQKIDFVLHYKNMIERICNEHMYKKEMKYVLHLTWEINEEVMKFRECSPPRRRDDFFVYHARRRRRSSSSSGWLASHDPVSPSEICHILKNQRNSGSTLSDLQFYCLWISMSINVLMLYSTSTKRWMIIFWKKKLHVCACFCAVLICLNSREGFTCSFMHCFIPSLALVLVFGVWVMNAKSKSFAREKGWFVAFFLLKLRSSANYVNTCILMYCLICIFTSWNHAL